jgi:hypothetical protein
MRPRRGLWGALAAHVNDANGAGVSWRVTSAWVRDYADNATTSSATLCFPQAISAGVGTVRERGASRMGHLGRPDGEGARRLARHEPANGSTSAWVSAYSGGGPLGG